MSKPLNPNLAWSLLSSPRLQCKTEFELALDLAGKTEIFSATSALEGGQNPGPVKAKAAAYRPG